MSTEFIEYDHENDSAHLFNTLRETMKVKRVRGTITNSYFDEFDTDRFTHYWLEVINESGLVEVIDKSSLDNKRLARDIYYKIFGCENCQILNYN